MQITVIEFIGLISLFVSILFNIILLARNYANNKQIKVNSDTFNKDLIHTNNKINEIEENYLDRFDKLQKSLDLFQKHNSDKFDNIQTVISNIQQICTELKVKIQYITTNK